MRPPGVCSKSRAGAAPLRAYTNSKYELRSYLESRWRRQSRLAPCETFGFERLLAHPLIYACVLLLTKLCWQPA